MLIKKFLIPVFLLKIIRVKHFLHSMKSGIIYKSIKKESIK